MHEHHELLRTCQPGKALNSYSPNVTPQFWENLCMCNPTPHPLHKQPFKKDVLWDCLSHPPPPPVPLCHPPVWFWENLCGCHLPFKNTKSLWLSPSLSVQSPCLSVQLMGSLRVTAYVCRVLHCCDCVSQCVFAGFLTAVTVCHNVCWRGSLLMWLCVTMCVYRVLHHRDCVTVCVYRFFADVVVCHSVCLPSSSLLWLSQRVLTGFFTDVVVCHSMCWQGSSLLWLCVTLCVCCDCVA